MASPPPHGGHSCPAGVLTFHNTIACTRRCRSSCTGSASPTVWSPIEIRYDPVAFHTDAAGHAVDVCTISMRKGTDS